MPKVQLVDGNEILHRHGIFLDVKDAGATEIDNAIPFHGSHHFSDAVKFGARTVIH